MTSKLLALLAVIGMDFLLMVGVFVKGWGMQPQSWGWIVAMGVFGRLFTALLARKVWDEFFKELRGKP